MSWPGHEWRLLARSRLPLWAAVLLLVLSSLAVWSGMGEIARQRDTITRLAPLHAQDVAAVARPFAGGGSAGNAAYYTFYNTWDPPSGAAFMALGLRDVAPYMLRIRALGLQGQLYDGETFNPELALPGKFDFSFVLVYLAPLFVIALLHDLMSSERESGRLRMLLAMPGAARHLWGRRLALRVVMLFISLCIPLAAGAVVSGMSAGVLAGSLLIVAAYLGFWGGLCMLVCSRSWSSSVNATILMAFWTVLTLVLPTAAQVAVTRAIPVGQGVDLMLAQRQNINAAWDMPREATMQAFFHTHPEWKDTAPLPEGFHWKWYFAFHQLGDESVAGQAQAYRAGLLARQSWSARLGWVLPGAGAQWALHRLAGTDLQAQLSYLDRIAGFHRDIRLFYYPYVFNDRRFGSDDFGKRPVFSSVVDPVQAAPMLWMPLVLLAVMSLLAGLLFARRVRS